MNRALLQYNFGKFFRRFDRNSYYIDRIYKKRDDIAPKMMAFIGLTVMPIRDILYVVDHMTDGKWSINHREYDRQGRPSGQSVYCPPGRPFSDGMAGGQSRFTGQIFLFLKERVRRSWTDIFIRLNRWGW